MLKIEKTPVVHVHSELSHYDCLHSRITAIKIDITINESRDVIMIPSTNCIKAAHGREYEILYILH